MLASETPEHGGECTRIFHQVRGNPMAKATLENAIWDLEAQREGISLAQLLGGSRETIACGVSLGIQSSIPELLATIEKELAAGYQRIKLKCKPGWDVEVFEKVRERWPGIMLSCDANSAYRLRDADHLVSFDAFDLLMIEQPLWADDFYYHSMLQNRLNTPICLDESIRNRRDALAAIEMESCKIINIKLGRVGGFSEAIAVHNAAQERGIPVWCGGMLESGIGRVHNIALSSLENFSLPGDVSASARYWREDIIEPEVTVTAEGEIAIPDTPGRGYEVRADLIERLTVRKEAIRAFELVA
jgi:O-succinylbenzoate synthase